MVATAGAIALDRAWVRPLARPRAFCYRYAACIGSCLGLFSRLVSGMVRGHARACACVRPCPRSYCHWGRAPWLWQSPGASCARALGSVGQECARALGNEPAAGRATTTLVARGNNHNSPSNGAHAHQHTHAGCGRARVAPITGKRNDSPKPAAACCTPYAHATRRAPGTLRASPPLCDAPLANT